MSKIIIKTTRSEGENINIAVHKFDYIFMSHLSTICHYLLHVITSSLKEHDFYDVLLQSMGVKSQNYCKTNSDREV